MRRRAIKTVKGRHDRTARRIEIGGMKAMKKVLALAALCVALTALAGFFAPRVQVTALDVGKADAILVTAPGCAVLIDTGSAETAPRVLQALQARGIRHLDALIVSHFDQDHIGGAAAVLAAVQVDAVYQPDYTRKTGAFASYCRALSAGGSAVVTVRAEETAQIGPLRFVLLPPPGGSATRSSNDHSLVTALYCGDVSFLLPGDASSQRLQELLDAQIGAFDVLKIPHHGIAEENTAEFLRMVAPDFAVVTTATADYADGDLVAQLRAMGTDVRSTCGRAVHYYCNGRAVYASGGSCLGLTKKRL